MVISFPKFQQQRLITELGKFCNSKLEEEADFVAKVKAAVEAEVNSMTLVILRVNFSDSIARSSIIQKHIVGLSKRTVKIKQISVRTRCSNHMTSIRFLFRDLDESQKCDIRLDDDKQVRVEGKGAIAIKTM
ncbi:hypothetical protein KY289_026758 [Solanum tuberosum]|nr:hypothetical protein KY289_026758 [Solanum tuberosum]